MDVYGVLHIENKVSVATDLMMTPNSLSTCVRVWWEKGGGGGQRLNDRRGKMVFC